MALRGLRIALAGLVMLGGVALPAAVSAQTSGEVSSDAALQKEYDDAFAAMMASPQDLDKTFHFAEVAARKGDFEGAISALERMLFINPDLPRVKLELGVLYYRLGSYETARSYLEDALNAPNVPTEVRTRTESFLSEINRRESVHQISGSIYAGARWQSNATASPSGTGVTVLGVPASLSTLFTSKSDFNIFGVLNTKYIYDFQDQNQDTFEVTGSFYGARQLDQTQVNTSFFELTAGPRIQVPTAWLWDGAKMSVRPYGIYDYIDLHDDYYYRAPGGGIEFLNQVRPGTVVQFNFETRDRHFKNTGLIPVASNQTGLEMVGRLQLTQAITDQISVLGGLSYADNRAQGDVFAPRDQAYHYYDFTVGANYSFDGPWQLTEQPWSLTGTATRAYYIYRQADPTVDPFRTRFDRDWRLAMVAAVPVANEWTVIGTVGYTMRNSSIVNYQFDNTYVSMGVSWRF